MPYRNPRLLQLAHHAPQCFLCSRTDTETVVAAHAVMGGSLGKGMGQKPADVVAFVCGPCHDWIDGRVKSESTLRQRHAHWSDAAVRSMAWALEHHPEVFCRRFEREG